MNTLNPISYSSPRNSNKGQSIANKIFTISINNPSTSNSHYFVSCPNTPNQTTYPELLTYPSFSYIYNNSLSPKLSEVQLYASEVQLRAYEVQLHEYEVQLHTCEAQLHACEAQLHANEAQIHESEVCPAISEVQLYANEESLATNEVRHHESETQHVDFDVILSLFSNSFKQNN